MLPKCQIQVTVTWLLWVCATFAIAQQPALFLRSADIATAVDLAASPSGDWYATLLGSGAVTIWSANNGFQYRTFAAGEAGRMPVGLGSISIAADAKTIAVAAGGSSEIKLYDVTTAQQIGSIQIPGGQNLTRIVFHPSRMLLATLDIAGNLSILECPSGAVKFHSMIDKATFVQFSADGSLLAVATPGAIHVIASQDGRELASFGARATYTQRLDRTMKAMVIKPSGSGMETQTAEQLQLFQFKDAALDASSRRVALAHADEIDIADVDAHKVLDSIPIPNATIRTCAFLSDHLLAVGLLGQDSFLYDVNTHVRSPFAAWDVAQFAPLPDGKRVLLRLGSGIGVRVGIKSISGGSSWSAFSENKLSSVSSFQFSPSREELLVGTFWATSPMTVWDLGSGEADSTVIPVQGIGTFAQSPDGSLLAWFGSEGYPDVKVHVWDRHTRTEVLSLPIKVQAGPEQIAFSPDGSKLAGLIDQPRAVLIWSMPDGKVLGDIPADQRSMQFLAWSPDGQVIAISQGSSTLIIDTPPNAAPRLRTTVNTQQGVQFAVAGTPLFSSDGSKLAVGGSLTIDLLDTKSWAPILKIPDANSSGFCFTPDSAQLLYRTFSPPSRNMTMDLRTGKASPLSSDVLWCTGSHLPGTDLWAVSHDGGIGIISGASGRTLATLYHFGNGGSADWLVITPDGLFDGTPAAWNQLSWRFSENTFDIAPVEIFFQNFYHPGLLAEIASGKIPKAPTSIADVDRRQPSVTLSSSADSPKVSTRTIHVQVAVTEVPSDEKRHLASGARDLRLFRNGTLVKAWRGDLKLDGSGKALLSADVPIVSGENRFTAYVFNKANIKSADAALLVTGADSIRRAGTAWVISLGVNHYAASAPANPLDLKFAEGDASDFASQFTQAQTQLGQFGQVRRIDLLGTNATKANLEAVLRLLAGNPLSASDPTQQQLLSGVTQVQPEDGVFLFYAGHGAARNGHFYLIPEDYNPIAPLSDPRANTVSDEELSRMLEGISPDRSFIVIDACNSGQAIDSTTPVGPMNATGLAQLAYEKGLYILAASKESEPALETNDLGSGHGFLTYALVDEGLKAGGAAQNGVVELRPWFVYASRRVPEMQASQRDRRGIIPDQPASDARQHPRIFYRREPELNPFIVAKTRVTSAPQN